MPYEGTPGLAEFDAGEALERAREVDGGERTEGPRGSSDERNESDGDDVLTFVEFTADEYNVVYVADEVLELYRDEAHMHDHFERVLNHLHLDFMERDAYEDMLLPNAGSVTALTTEMEEMTLLRLLSGDDGLYVALAPSADVRAIIDAVEPVTQGS